MDSGKLQGGAGVAGTVAGKHKSRLALARAGDHRGGRPAGLRHDQPALAGAGDAGPAGGAAAVAGHRAAPYRQGGALLLLRRLSASP